MPSDEKPQYLTIPEIKKEFHIGERSLRRWNRSGALPLYKPGRSTLARRDELEKLIASTKLPGVQK